jgi:hypothetical protein
MVPMPPAPGSVLIKKAMKMHFVAQFIAAQRIGK